MRLPPNKQPWLAIDLRVDLSPVCSVSHHGIEDGEQLPCDGDEGNLGWLPGSDQALVWQNHRPAPATTPAASRTPVPSSCRISTGWVTHSARALDIALDFVEAE